MVVCNKGKVTSPLERTDVLDGPSKQYHFCKHHGYTPTKYTHKPVGATIGRPLQRQRNFAFITLFSLGQELPFFLPVLRQSFALQNRKGKSSAKTFLIALACANRATIVWFSGYNKKEPRVKLL